MEAFLGAFSFGAKTTVVGEGVFNTGMTGYQGNPHRPFLLWTDRNHDESSNRKLRNKPKR